MTNRLLTMKEVEALSKSLTSVGLSAKELVRAFAKFREDVFIQSQVDQLVEALTVKIQEQEEKHNEQKKKYKLQNQLNMRKGNKHLGKHISKGFRGRYQ